MTQKSMLAFAITLAALVGGVGGWSLAKSTYPPLQVLASTTETVIGQPFTYPAGRAKITAALVTIEPGKQTGWHRHDVPLLGYIVEGSITVDYGDDGKRQFGPGDAFVEAFKTPHNGRNEGNVPARILAVFAGAETTPNTVMAK